MADKITVSELKRLAEELVAALNDSNAGANLRRLYAKQDFRDALTAPRVVALCEAAEALQPISDYFGRGRFGNKYAPERKALTGVEKALATLQAAFTQEKPDAQEPGGFLDSANEMTS